MDTIVIISGIEFEKPIYLRFESSDYHIWASDGHVKIFYKNVIQYEWIAKGEENIDIDCCSPTKFYNYRLWWCDADDSYSEPDSDSEPNLEPDLVSGWDNSSFTDEWDTEFITFKYNQAVSLSNFHQIKELG